MKRSFLMLPALLAATVMSAHAQTPAHSDPSDPADSSQPGIPAAYRSAFDGYLPHRDSPAPSLENWRAANDLVGALGGHGGHLDTPAAGHDHAGRQKPEQPAPSPSGYKEHDHAH